MKIPFVDHKLLLNVINLDIPTIEQENDVISKKDVILTKSRSTTIIHDFVGHVFSIYNGNKYLRVKLKRLC